MSEKIYSWEFNDDKNRSNMWYIIALSIVLGVSVWGFFTKQYGLSFIILLIAGLYYFIQNNSNNQIKVEITNLGILIDGSFYDFKSIDSYGIVYKGEKPILLRLNLNKKGIRNIDIEVTNEIINDIKEILNQYLEEGPKIEFSLSERIIQLLKL